jgi:hypothetical protein
MPPRLLPLQAAALFELNSKALLEDGEFEE